MNANYKMQAFEYVVKCLCDWFIEAREDESITPLQDFNKLKLFKLHFFVASICTSPRTGKTDDDLLTVFDDFYALPYGPVESGVYDHLSETKIYNIGDDCVEQKSDDLSYFETLPLAIREKIDQSVDKLKKINNDLVCYDAFRLVDISHQWLVWKMAYSNAVNKGKRSEKISSELIRNSLKIFA